MKLFFSLILITSFITSCKIFNKSKTVVYNSEKNVQITIKSSCKISAVEQYRTDSSFKEKIAAASLSSMTKQKIKNHKSIEKSHYKINKTEFIITERCSAKTKDDLPFIGLQEILVLENIKSKEITEFRVDTVFVNSQALGQPKTLVPKKIVLDEYAKKLTEKNYQKVKQFLSLKK